MNVGDCFPRLPAARRATAPDDAVRIVRFIKRAQDLGFSLAEVEELLRLRRQSGRNRARVRSVAEETIQQIDKKVAELERMKRALQTLVHSCRDGATLDCPIIEALDT
jgi:DNA-binding transcriptional MerR regulator